MNVQGVVAVVVGMACTETEGMRMRVGMRTGTGIHEGELHPQLHYHQHVLHEAVDAAYLYV